MQEQLTAHVAEVAHTGNVKTYFEAKVEPHIAVLGRDALDGAPKTLKEWLRFYDAFKTVENEVLLETTLELRRRHPEAFAHAINTLAITDRADLNATLEAAAVPESTARAMSQAMRDRASYPRILRADDAPIRLRFACEPEPSTGHMRPLVGELTVLDANGAALGRYVARTGRSVRGWWNRYGPTPPGFYTVSNYRASRPDQPAMELNGVSFSFDIDPTSGTDIGDRSLLRIHPDGSVKGTIGCVGAFGTADELRDCAAQISGLLEERFRFLITYGTLYTVTKDCARWAQPNSGSGFVLPELYAGASTFRIEPSPGGWVRVLVDGYEPGYLLANMVQALAIA